MSDTPQTDRALKAMSCRTWIATMDRGGESLVILPRELTPADLDDLRTWFALILQSLSASSVAATPTEQEQDEDATTRVDSQ